MSVSKIRSCLEEPPPVGTGDPYVRIIRLKIGNNLLVIKKTIITLVGALSTMLACLQVLCSRPEVGGEGGTQRRIEG